MANNYYFVLPRGMTHNFNNELLVQTQYSVLRIQDSVVIKLYLKTLMINFRLNDLTERKFHTLTTGVLTIFVLIA